MAVKASAYSSSRVARCAAPDVSRRRQNPARRRRRQAEGLRHMGTGRPLRFPSNSNTQASCQGVLLFDGKLCP